MSDSRATRFDSRLAAIVAAWPELPEAILLGIVAMVKARALPRNLTEVGLPTIP